MKKTVFRTALLLMLAVIPFVSCGDDDDDATGGTMSNSLSISPNNVSLLGEANSTTTITIKTEQDWFVSGAPEWLHLSASSGVGSAPITLTALSLNFSDEPRTATLYVTAGSTTSQVIVNQSPGLATGCRVSLSNMTLMSDGFAADMTFGSNAKGYREGFYTEAAVRGKTTQDLFNELMTNDEYEIETDYTFLPGKASPGTTIVYCVAAYGSENNSDGTHKYGPITIERVTIPEQTVYDDMKLTLTYNTAQWTVNATRSGSIGQRCAEYYYLAAEGSLASTLNLVSTIYTDAWVAHIYFKPMIAQDANNGYMYGPQVMPFLRSGDQFYCATWGIDRDTKVFSNELSVVYRDLSSSNAATAQRKPARQTSADWNKPAPRPSRAEIEQVIRSARLIKAN